LHGIDAVDKDLLISQQVGGTGGARSDATNGVTIANEALLGDQEIRKALTKDGKYEHARGTRTSLTFRKVNKVMKGKLPFGLSGQHR
jgi:hypothetical protein